MTKTVSLSDVAYQKILDESKRREMPIGEMASIIILTNEFMGEEKSSTHTEKEKFKSRVVYGKGVKPVYPLNSRERRLKAIGKLLLGTDIINLKGLERLIIMQKVGDRRVINDYKRVLDIKGWVIKVSPNRYTVAQDVISDELNIPLVGGHKTIE